MKPQVNLPSLTKSFLLNFIFSHRILFTLVLIYCLICISTIWNNSETTYNRWEWYWEVLKQMLSLCFIFLLDPLFCKHHKFLLPRSVLSKKEKAIPMANQKCVEGVSTCVLTGSCQTGGVASRCFLSFWWLKQMGLCSPPSSQY